MALTATTSRNPDVMETYDGIFAGLPASGTINEGDMVCWDATLNSGNGALRTVAAQADMADFLGVAEMQTPIASLGDVLTNISIRRSGIVRFKTTAAETYKMFQAVYFNDTADVQTVTNNTNSGARTKAVGFVVIPQQLVVGGTLTVTGAAGTDIYVMLTPQYPQLAI